MIHLSLLDAGYIPNGPVWVNVYLPEGDERLYYSRLVGRAYYSRFAAAFAAARGRGTRPDAITDPIYRIKITPKVLS